jgi:hypothetical protein
MARAGLRSLPRNVTDVARVLVRLDGGVRNDAVSAEVASLRTEDALPIRQFFAWPGKRNYEGVWWSSTNRGHVDFESLLEREYLLASDAASMSSPLRPSRWRCCGHTAPLGSAIMSPTSSFG